MATNGRSRPGIRAPDETVRLLLSAVVAALILGAVVVRGMQLIPFLLIAVVPLATATIYLADRQAIRRMRTRDQPSIPALWWIGASVATAAVTLGGTFVLIEIAGLARDPGVVREINQLDAEKRDLTAALTAPVPSVSSQPEVIAIRDQVRAKDDEVAKANQAVQEELDGSGGSGTKGPGPIWKAKSAWLDEKKAELKQLQGRQTEIEAGAVAAAHEKIQQQMTELDGRIQELESAEQPSNLSIGSLLTDRAAVAQRNWNVVAALLFVLFFAYGALLVLPLGLARRAILAVDPVNRTTLDRTAQMARNAELDDDAARRIVARRATRRTAEMFDDRQEPPAADPSDGEREPRGEAAGE